MPNLSRKRSALFFTAPTRGGFTLIEVLVSLAIVAVLSTVVVVTLNPAELLKQARDSNRISDLNTINTALGTFAADVVGGSVGASSTVYVSLPSNNSDCSDLGLPTLTGGWVYKCATRDNLTKIDGTGWIPVNFQRISFGNPLEKLPIDQKNTTSTGLYYTFVSTGSWWELTAILESAKYGPRMVVDGGASPNAFEQGTNLTLTPTEALDRGVPPDLTIPSIASISPTSTTAGDPPFTLTVVGENFTSSSVVRWGASDKTTTFISATQLTASILAGDISASGTIAVTVYDPVKGTSGSSNFAIGERTQFIAGAWTTDSSAGPAQSSGASILEVAGNLYIAPGGSNAFRKYDPVAKSWATLAAAPGSFGSAASFTKYNNDTIYALAGGNTNSLYKYIISTNTWSSMANTPSVINEGAAITYPGYGDYIYVLRGNSSSDFWRYSISNNNWGQSGVAQSYGASILDVNGNFYIIPGNYNTFQKYNPTTGAWTNLAAAPANFSSGASLTKYDNDTIYALFGGTLTNFAKYTISTNSWTNLAATPSGVHEGGALTYPGSGDIIYAIKGWGSDYFWGYSISNNSWGLSQSGVAQSYGASILDVAGILYVIPGGSTAFQKYNPSTNSWTSLAAAPASFNSGASLAKYDNDTIYALIGGTATNFAKYTISTNSWTSLTATPSGVHEGGALTYPGSGNDIYAIKGWGSSTFWKYSISGNSWTTATSLPSTVRGGVAMTAFDTNTLYVLQGTNSATFWKYTISSGTWETKASAPAYVGPGGSLTTDGTNIYASRGAITKTFWKYVPGTDSWSALASTTYDMGTNSIDRTHGGIAYSASLNKIYAISGTSNGTVGSIFYYDLSTGYWPSIPSLPSTVRGGVAMTAFDTNTLYVLQGTNSATFWKYTISSGTWETKASAPSIVGPGGSLATDGTNIYASKGNLTKTFWKYVPGTNSWSALASTTYDMGTNSIDRTSGGIAYSQSINKIYAVPGFSNGTAGSVFYYDLATGLWPDVPNAPITPRAGVAMVALDSDTLYAIKGSNTSEFWKYTISSGTWVSMASTPALAGPGASLATDGTNIYASQGNSATGFWKYIPSSNSWSTLTVTPAVFGTASIDRTWGGISYSPTQNAIYGISGNSVNLYKNSQ